jgi:hypothetical protein
MCQISGSNPVELQVPKMLIPLQSKNNAMNTKGDSVIKFRPTIFFIKLA